MGFKQDQTFLQYLTMGAIVSARVSDDLNRHRHRVMELERYTAANKIWTTKIKRLRLPDLICVACGLRVEARGKSKLEIRLSDSPGVPGRKWDAGMDAADLVAFVQVTWDGESAVASDFVNYFRVADLQATSNQSKLGPPKSAGEGAERDRTWPGSVPSYDGTVSRIEGDYVTLQRSDGRSRRARLRDGHRAYTREGDEFRAGARFVSGIVAIPDSVECLGETWAPTDAAFSDDPGKRYAAVKVLGVRGDQPNAEPILQDIWERDGEDFRVRLEALAGLARRRPEAWIDKLVEQTQVEAPGMAMEAVLILAELPIPQAANGLSVVLGDERRDGELRAAAAWGLGPQRECRQRPH